VWGPEEKTELLRAKNTQNIKLVAVATVFFATTATGAARSRPQRSRRPLKLRKHRAVRQMRSSKSKMSTTRRHFFKLYSHLPLSCARVLANWPIDRRPAGRPRGAQNFARKF
jgi:hypothetical protein